MTEELDFIGKLEDKYEKMKNEYNEVGRNALRDKYENLQYLMQSIYSLVKDGYRYRKLESELVDKYENN